MSSDRQQLGKHLKTSKGIWLVLSVVLAISTFLRFYHLNGYGLWSDEFVTLAIVSVPSYREVIKTCFHIPQPIPPLYFLVEKWVCNSLPPGEISLRLLSAASSSISAYLVYLLGKKLFNVQVGILGCLLFAVDSTQIVYAQNARPYSFCLLLSLLSMLCLTEWLGKGTSRHWVGYIAATVFLFYSHYVFFPLLIIQNLYVALTIWRRKSLVPAVELKKRVPESSLTLSGIWPGWKSWVVTQVVIVVLLSPLYSQIWRIIQKRHSLNWESKFPSSRDLLAFVHQEELLWSIMAVLIVVVVSRLLKSLRIVSEIGEGSASTKIRFDGWTLILLWYLTPITLFFLLAKWTGINLFVERYLVLTSIAPCLIIPAIATHLRRRWLGWIALAIYFGLYVSRTPVRFFIQNGQFSQGVPGGNEWRETLTKLDEPDFQAEVLLFQSPFIESNELGFESDSKLRGYLSAPLQSFYLQQPNPVSVLLPVHWWIQNSEHMKFKTQLANLLMTKGTVTLLCTQEFWNHFQPWLLHSALAWNGQPRIDREFRSSGALRLHRITMAGNNH